MTEASTDRPDQFDKLALLGTLRHAHAQADSYVDTIGDAAALAANQVQDVRLAHLESGGTLLASDIVFELFLAIALEHVGGDAVSAITRTLMSRILSSRRALMIVAGRTDLGDRIAAKLRAARLIGFAESGPPGQLAQWDAFGDVLLRLRGDRLYGDLPFKTADLSTRVVWHTARQVPFNPPRYTRLSVLDTPGVALLDNVSAFVLRQKTLNRVLFGEVADIVVLDLLSRDEISTLIKELDVFSTALYRSQSLTAVKQHFKLYFEACIWARVLDPPPRIRSSPPLIDIGDIGKSRDLTAYLLARIVNPQTGAPFEQSVRLIPDQFQRRRGEATSERDVIKALLDYFKVLRTTITEHEARLPPDGRSQWNNP